MRAAILRIEWIQEEAMFRIGLGTGLLEVNGLRVPILVRTLSTVRQSSANFN